MRDLREIVDALRERGDELSLEAADAIEILAVDWRNEWIKNKLKREDILEQAAQIAEGVKNGYTAAITGDGPEPDGTTKFVQDIDGPWVMNSDVAKAIREAK